MYEMRIYLLNNTQPYRDDEEEGYAGGWFNCPVDLEEVRERLGVENEEQLEIADYELRPAHDNPEGREPAPERGAAKKPPIAQQMKEAGRKAREQRAPDVPEKKSPSRDDR